MKLLILGGTVFLGRHLTEIALAHGHELTLFNRGRSNPGLFPGIETIHGDRDEGFAALAGRSWDAVIDVAAYVPGQVELAASQITAGHYTLISTISVFADFSRQGLSESDEVAVLDPSAEPEAASAYGPLKALCEQAIREARPEHSLIIRPGLIVGPFDPTDRFTYWPLRVARGGEVLAPEGGHVPVQLVDARDLAEWTLRMVEERATGTYNATSPAGALTLGDVFKACITARPGVSGADVSVTYVPEAFLRERGVSPWAQMPLWVGGDPSMAGFAGINVEKAVGAGLTFRPLAATAADTLAWAQAKTPTELRAGITPEHEAQLLCAWHTLTSAHHVQGDG